MPGLPWALAECSARRRLPESSAAGDDVQLSRQRALSLGNLLQGRVPGAPGIKQALVEQHCHILSHLINSIIICLTFTTAGFC